MNRFPLRHFLALVLFAAGCTAPFAPSVSPVSSPRVKPGAKYEALVVLPDKALASVILHYAYFGGRLAITGVSIVNQNPDKVTIFFSKTQIYVGENEPLPVARYSNIEPDKRPIDLKVMRHMPPGAEGKWIIPKRLILKHDTIGTPVVVIFYSAHGRDGFVKIRYQPVWDIPG